MEGEDTLEGTKDTNREAARWEKQPFIPDADLLVAKREKNGRIGRGQLQTA